MARWHVAPSSVALALLLALLAMMVVDESPTSSKAALEDFDDVTSLLQLQRPSHEFKSPVMDKASDRKEEETKAWDYVILGGGNAGLVVATRLALADYNVLVVETGQDITPEGKDRGDTGCSFYESVDDPVAISKMQGSLTYDVNSTDCPKPFFSSGWNPPSTQILFTTEHSRMITTDPLLHGQKNWQYQTSVANTAGGSTVTNGKVIGRHKIEDYNIWSKWVDHWDAEAMRPYYNKALSPFAPDGSTLRPLDQPAFEGANGPIELTRPTDHVDANAVPNVSPDTPKSNDNIELINKFKEACLKAYGIDADLSEDKWPGAAEGCSNQWFSSVDRHGKISDATNYLDKLLSPGQMCTEAPDCTSGSCVPNKACPSTTRVTMMYKTMATKILFDRTQDSADEPRAIGVEVTPDRSRERALHPTEPIKTENCKKMADPTFNKWNGDFIPGVIGGEPKPVLFSNSAANRSYPTDFDTPYYADGDDVSVRYTIQARKEVILAAGAFNSPKILSLSGIGRREDLEAIGVGVLVDSPVGENVADHPEASVQVMFTRPLSPGGDAQLLKDETLYRTAPQVHQEYLGRMGVGVATIMGGLEGKAAKSAKLDPLTASLLERGGGLDYHMHFTLGSFVNYDPASTPFQTSSKFGGFTFLCEGSFNHASGKMRVKSKSPKDPVAWEPPFTTHRADVTAVVACARMGNNIRLEMEKTLGMATELRPPWSTVDFNDDESIAHAVRLLMWGHHPHASCRMGRSRAEGGVVNWRGSVIGAKGVRVVDAAALPRLLHGNPMTQVYAAAERFSDLIIEDASSS